MYDKLLSFKITIFICCVCEYKQEENGFIKINNCITTLSLGKAGNRLSF